MRHTSESRRAVLASLLTACLPSLGAAGLSRSALVVGNARYSFGALRNSVSDAQNVATVLRDLGFKTTLHKDTTLQELIEAFRRFSRDSEPDDVRLVFYAGHGIQYRGRNYLVPVDSRIQHAGEIASLSADATELVDRLSGFSSGVNIVILDACRLNPFSEGVFVDANGKTRTTGTRAVMMPGLAPMKAKGTLVAYSSAPNAPASDGPAGHGSPYTKHLVANMKIPGTPIQTVFQRVGEAVQAETEERQVPWVSSSLVGNFCFRLDANGLCGN